MFWPSRVRAAAKDSAVRFFSMDLTGIENPVNASYASCLPSKTDHPQIIKELKSPAP